MIWYEILYSVCVACFFAGLVLVVLLIILATSNLSSSSSDVDNDIGDHDIGDHDIGDHDIGDHDIVDHDIGDHDIGDHDIGDHDFGDHDFGDHDIGDHDIGDHDIGDHDLGDHDLGDHDLGDHDLGDHDTGHHEIDMHHNIEHHGITRPEAVFQGLNDKDQFIHSKSHTPVSLVFSLYILWFGTIGLIFYTIIPSKIAWAITLSFVPIVIVKLLTKVWGKFAKNTLYRLYLGNDLLGREATVKIDVTTEGGLVSIKQQNSIQQIGVHSLFPLSYFYSGDTVFVCAYRNGIYLVDSNPNNVELPEKVRSQRRRASVKSSWGTSAKQPDL